MTQNRDLISAVGHRLLAFIHYVGSLCVLTFQIGRAVITGQVKLIPFIQECDLIGNRSFLTIALVSFFMGMVLAMQAGIPLKMTGGEFYIATIVALSAVREIGPLIAAFLLAGRIGSANAAEIGTMKITEQLDALRTLSVDPVKYLVVPKFLAACLMLPVLTIMAIALQILGGYILGTTTLNLSTGLFLYQAFRFIALRDIGISMLKAVVFGMIIIIVSSREGFFAEEGARGVGRAATRAVVSSLFLIILADFIITAVFYFI